MKKKKIIIISLIIILLIGLLIFLTHKKAKPILEKNNKSTEFLLSKSDVFKVKVGKVDNIIGFTGDLVPLNQAVISAQINAQVLKVIANEGQFVKKGQILAILDDSNLKQSLTKQQALFNSAKVKLALVKNKLDKNTELLNQGFISKLAYNGLQTDYQAALEEMHEQQADLYNSQKSLSETIIHAPFAGFIYEKNIDAGQLAAVNGKLFSLANLDIMQIKAPITSDQINSIAPKQSASFKVETSDKEYQGIITRINPVAEKGTRSYIAYINFDNSQSHLKAGQFVKGQITINSLDNVINVPTDSIRDSKTSKYVLVVDNGKILSKPVKILLTNNLHNISAISGIKENETIVAGNVISVKSGDSAKVEE